MEKIKLIATFLFLTIFLIFSISLIVAGSAHAGNPKPLRKSNCTLKTQELVQCSDGTWQNTWNQNITESIFSCSFEWFSDKYKINQTYPCVCDELCYLDIRVMEFVHFSNLVFEYGSNVMISIGSIMLVSLFVYAIIICKRNMQHKFVYILEEEKNGP